VVAARLYGSLGRARYTGAAAGDVRDLRRPTELAGDHDQNPFVETPVADVFDERRHGPIKVRGAVPEGIEHVVVDGVIVPVLHAAAERTGQLARDDLNARLDQPPRHQELGTLATRFGLAVDADGESLTDVVASFFGGGSSNCDTGSDSGSYGGD